MDFTVKAADFARVLARVHHAVEKKTTIPILRSISLKTQGNRLRCQATDLEVAVSDSIEVKTVKEGAVCLPGDKLVQIIRQLPEDQDVRFLVGTTNAAQITCGRSKFRLAGNTIESFPEIPEMPEKCISIDGKTLIQDFDRTRFAVSTQESRFTLSAVLVDIKDGYMVTAATDGHRMAFGRREFDTSVKFKGLIPVKTVSLIPKTMDHAFINLAEDDTHFYFQQGTLLIVTRKAVGNFPDYSRVLPDHPNSLKINRQAFLASIQRALTCAQEGKDVTPPVRLQFGKDALTLFASDNTANESSDEIELAYDGDPFEIGIAGRYLTEPLSALETAEVSLHFKDKKSAMEIRPEPEDGYRYVVMPMRI